MKVLVTGGCGFIGTNFIKYLLTDSEISEDISIINLDKRTYAGKGENIEHLSLHNHRNYEFINGDINNKELVEHILKQRPDIIFNFAAESHVDRSIEDSDNFEKSNFLGACNLFKLSLKHNISRFIQISTDEVYGSINEGSFNETDKLDPSSPYSTCKAASDLAALGYFKTHKLPVIITRSANNYGPYQFPEKILPLFVTNLIDNKKVPLMWSEDNPGLNVRDWLHVRDNCRAIWFVSQNGDLGEIYNIPGENEKTNIFMTKQLLKYFNFDESMIEKVIHRKAHDFRYSITGEKLKSLGFHHTHKENLEQEIKNLITWYQDNESWWRPLKK